MKCDVRWMTYENASAFSSDGTPSSLRFRVRFRIT